MGFSSSSDRGSIEGGVTPNEMSDEEVFRNYSEVLDGTASKRRAVREVVADKELHDELLCAHAERSSTPPPEDPG